MTLRLESDPAPANWLTADERPWGSVVSIGPAGFEAYGRLRFIPDPEHPGQQEGDVEAEFSPYDGDQWPALVAALAPHTRTPADCYFCLWDGWPFQPRPSIHPLVRLLGKVGVSDDPGLVRAYYLFRGPLSDFGNWGPSAEWLESGEWDAAFIWPADRAWCIANDVDPHYAGIGAAASVIDELTTNRELDVVVAEPDADQPAYS